MKFAVLALLLSGCVVVPFVDSSGHVTGCCEAYTDYHHTLVGISVERKNQGVDVSAHTKWAFR